MVELVLVKAEECRPVREAVLRAGQPPATYTYAEDDDERSLHLSLKDGEDVLAVISMLHDPREGLGSEVWRIRGMAVVPEHQREGLGSKLLATVQAVAEKRGGGLWANVRTSAVPFYGARGFEPLGEEFEIEGAGPHLVMTWHPKP